jgi:hypothetical protein
MCELLRWENINSIQLYYLNFNLYFIGRFWAYYAQKDGNRKITVNVQPLLINSLAYISTGLAEFGRSILTS